MTPEQPTPVVATTTAQTATPTMNTRAFCKRNLVSQDLLPLTKPWENQQPIPTFATKEAYRAWCSSPDTDHVFFSVCEGENPAMVPGGANKPLRIHGFVGDYDTTHVTADDFIKALKRCSPTYPPTAWNTTRSGGARVLWMFQEPVFFTSPKTYKRFYERVKKETKADRILPGFDNLSEKPAQFYTCGGGWAFSEANFIRSDVLNLWLMECSKETDFEGNGLVIPMDLVAAEVERKFPGRWQGEFKEGARGCRFWAPEGDAKSVIVRSNGCQAFTGDKPFLTWRELLGKEFVDKYLADRIGSAIKNLHFDGRSFYRQLPDERWDCMTSESQVRRELLVQYGLKSSPAKGESMSEIDAALHRIEKTKRVAGAIPFPGNPQSIVKFNEELYLNVATAKPWQLALDPQEWGVNFPWIADFIDGLFIDKQTKEYFLAWLHVWLKSYHEGDPRKGQALFIAGPPGTGKTFLSNHVIARLVGGYAEATRFIVEGHQFNDGLFGKAAWLIDDALVAADRKAHAKFSSWLKALTANQALRYEKKYGGALDVPFNGRLIVTLNDDPESLNIIPDTDLSLLDKIVLLRTSARKAPVAFNVRERYEILDHEMQYFARYVHDYQIPEWIRPDNRFGIKEWHDPALLEEATAVTESSSVVEIVNVWRHAWAALKSSTVGPNPKTGEMPTHWEGTATELLSQLKETTKTKHAAASLTAMRLGRRMSQASINRVPWINRRIAPGGIARLITIQLPSRNELNAHENRTQHTETCNEMAERAVETVPPAAAPDGIV